MSRRLFERILSILILAVIASFVAPIAQSSDALAVFGKKYSTLDRAIHWAGNALVPQAVAQARLARFVPASAVSYDDMEGLLQSGKARLSVKMKDDYYYVMEMGSMAMTKINVDDTFDALEMYLGKEIDTVGFIIPSSDYESSALAEKIKKEGIDAAEIISWRPQDSTQKQAME